MSDITERLSSAIADRYKIESHLGQGGMATVYLAHDLKHDRKVALKVLRPELAAVIGAERFLQEIKVTANLQHPHILPLHDSGEADSFLYYVMPYIEGESLRDKIDKEKQLGIDDAVDVARSVASALDYAHRQGVIHRDIKPENILIHDGQALVADFGIALAISEASGNRLTETGLSIGTPHYMSPEQAMGDRELDARSDVYSLGAMMYEMLTGDPPYQGSTAQAIVAKVITEKAPPVTAARDTTPPHIAAAVHKALSKLPADRFASAAAFADALTRPGAIPLTVAAEAGPEALRKRTVPAVGAIAAAALIAAIALLVGRMTAPEPAPPSNPAFRSEIVLPEAMGVAQTGGQLIAISPDGSRIVYVGTAEGGGTQLFLRRVGDLAIVPLPGTEGVSNPFFSPDGEWIGFELDNELKKIAVAGGPPLTIARVNPSRPHWGQNDTIIDASGSEPLYTVPGAGGIPVPVPVADTTLDLRSPHMLPGGGAALVTIFAGLEGSQIGLVDLETGAIDTLVSEGVRPVYLSTGHVLYGHASGGVFVVPFDVERRVVTGSPTPVLDNVRVFGGGPVQFEVAQNGTAVYLTGQGGQGRELVTVDMAGREEPLALEPERYASPRFSPDGGRIALTMQGDATDVYVFEMARGTLSRLTFQGNNLYPVWSPDGRYVMFGSRLEGTLDHDIFRKVADGSGPPELVLQAEYANFAQSWADDGTILYRTRSPGGLDLSVLQSGDSTGTPYLAEEWNEYAGAVSPDGRWVAYVSNETDANEVYVRAFPEPAGRWQVSQGGGSEPIWAPDGRTIYYWRGPAELVAARVQTQPSFAVLGEETVLQGRYERFFLYPQYDIHPDGDRFVMIKNVAGDAVGGITVVVNWFEELRERLGR